MQKKGAANKAFSGENFQMIGAIAFILLFFVAELSPQLLGSLPF